MNILIRNLPYLLTGAVQTLYLAAACIVLSTLLGFFLGIVALVFVVGEGTHGIYIAFGLTDWVVYARTTRSATLVARAMARRPEDRPRITGALGLAMLVMGCLTGVIGAAVGGALTIYAAAFVCEIVRGAIASVPRGQINAAKSLGLRWHTILFDITLPQAMKLSLPPLVSNAVVTVKITSYVAIVGVWELTYAGEEVVERTLAAFQIFSGVMAIYFVICYPLTLLARFLERRLAYVE